MKDDRTVEKLIAEVDALCLTFEDEDKAEQWGETLKRIDRLRRLVKKLKAEK